MSVKKTLGIKAYNIMMGHLTRKKIPQTAIKTADEVEQPPVKEEISDREAINAFMERNPKADGGRIGFAEGLPKNIRLTDYGRYRFTTEAGGGFNKTFPKGTPLKEVVKFRDDKLKEFGIEKGKNRPVNPDRGNYVGVKDQKHIKFNGVTYQVQVQRMKDGKMVTEKPFYTKSLTEAKKVRDQRVAKSPPKSFKDFNIKERPKKINAEILELSKNPTIKNIFKTGVLTNEAITEAANILKVNKATAIDRLENLATAFSGDRTGVPGIKPTNIDNARKIAASLPGAKTKAAELATGVPFTRESIKVPKGQIYRDAPYDTSLFDIDEARATATGLKRGTSPYSIFGQIIKQDINRGVKGGFAGSGWDSRAGTLERNLDEAIQKFGAKSKQAKTAKIQYNKEATLFENKINKNKRRGAKKIEIPKISLNAPSKTIANYKNLDKTYQNVFNENFKTKKYSFKIPKNLNPIPKIVEDFKDPKVRAKVERAAALGDARLYANPMFSPGVLGKAFSTIPTPAGAVALTAGFGVDPTSSIDRASIAAEAAFAPALVKQSAKMGAAQRLFNLGFNPRMAMRIARVASPLGIASLGAEGLYQAGKFTKKRIGELKAMTPEQRRNLRAEQSALAFEGARDGGLIGDKSGPAPESGPQPQGLPGIYKRGKKL
tara:strand:- start:940 stop:2919 length:1980 start_codon:yes stop_codon:yes gene_type:complete